MWFRELISPVIEKTARVIWRSQLATASFLGYTAPLIRFSHNGFVPAGATESNGNAFSYSK
jgi:hypothetical protein